MFLCFLFLNHTRMSRTLSFSLYSLTIACLPLDHLHPVLFEGLFQFWIAVGNKENDWWWKRPLVTLKFVFPSPFPLYPEFLRTSEDSCMYLPHCLHASDDVSLTTPPEKHWQMHDTLVSSDLYSILFRWPGTSHSKTSPCSETVIAQVWHPCSAHKTLEPSTATVVE